jgi:CRP-like cAMP-binding protein
MRNRLLATLSTEDLNALDGALEPVRLPFGQQLCEPNQEITQVYFMTTGVGSMLNEPNPGEIIEVATIGNEGMVGLPLLLGTDRTPSRIFMQVPGEGFRMTAEAFRRSIDNHPAFRAALMRYTMALLTQISQNASCNRLHEVQERCARWLLQTHDRVEGDEFPLTQDFLAQMLGVHRPTVSVAAGMLQNAGLISYRRGIITIINRAALEEASCSCYGFITREYDRLLAK